MVWPYSDPRWLRMDKAFVVLTLALFVACVLSWKGVPVFGRDPQFRPRESVFLAGGLLLQAVAGVLRRRSYVLFYLLLASSMVALWFSATAR